MDMNRSETERVAEEGVLRVLANVAGPADASARLAGFGATEIEPTDAEGLAMALGVVRGVGRTAAPVNVSSRILSQLVGSLTDLPSVAVGQALVSGEVSVTAMPEGSQGVMALDAAGYAEARLWHVCDLELVERGTLDDGNEVGRWCPRAHAKYRQYNATDVAMIRLALADAEMLAAAESMIERTLDHLKTRVQFGRPVGAFQALQHRMADAHVAVQAAGLACNYAAALIHADDSKKAFAWTLLCHAHAAEAATGAAQTCFQMHGGMAFTAEFWPHRWLRRVFRLAAEGGSPQHHYQIAARAIRSKDDLDQFITLSGQKEAS